MHPIGFWTSALGRPEPRFGKRLTALAIATLMALLSTGPQAAQAAAEKTSPPPADTAAAGEVKKGPVLAGYRGLVGREIRNQANETIGEIDNVIVDLDGDIIQAVVSVGGVWGIGDETVIVPLERFQLTQKRSYVFYNGTEEELRAYPAYRGFADRGPVGRYPYRRYFPPHRVGPGDTYYRDFGQRDFRAYYGQGRMPLYDEHRPRQRRENRMRTKTDAGAVAGGRSRRTASELIGRDVSMATGETIGSIDDLIVDSQGRVKLVIAVSDAIADGGKKILADLQDVQQDAEGLLYDISQKELEREPAYTSPQP